MTDSLSGEHGEFTSEMLAILRDSLGSRFLNYLIGETVGAPADQAITSLVDDEARLSVLRSLWGMWSQLPSNLDDEGKTQGLKYLLLHADEGKSIARELRENFVTDIRPPTADNLEKALLDAAFEVYPALLLPPDPNMTDPLFGEHLSSLVPVVIYRKSLPFMEAVKYSEDLSRIFTHVDPHIGPSVTYRSNTGMGGTLQLWMLPDSAIRGAWQERGDSYPSVSRFSEMTLERFRRTREVLKGKKGRAVAKIAFAGALLPSDAPLKFGAGVVRPVTVAERQNAPQSLRGQVSGQVGDEDPVTVNYDGDILLEYGFPYKIQLGVSLDDPGLTPPDMLPPNDIDRTALRLRFALMLAVERVPRAQLMQTWSAFTVPIFDQRSISWSDPRQGPGFMPIQLTNEDVESWMQWFGYLSARRVDRIELALSRILRAVAERRDMSDVLIDSVIAWENLFGTKEGEPTFRVTMCLAKLLKNSFEDRKAFKARLGKIYSLRSKIVHGSGNLQLDEHPLCRQALDVAIDAIRILISQRTDILDIPDGAIRSSTLLLDQ
jgi:hypothetical protein